MGGRGRIGKGNSPVLGIGDWSRSFPAPTPLTSPPNLPASGIEPLAAVEPMIPAGVIRIWGCLGAANEEFDLLLDRLTGQEQERAKGYRFPKDRLRFIRARVFLRHLLAGHLGCEPAEIAFKCNQWGKPTIEHPAEHDLHFNLSHSEDVVLIAMSSSAEIGVDVERIREVRADNAIVRRQFSTPEQHYVAKARDRVAAFFAIWTAKEAYIKGLGYGLAHPLTKFSTTSVPDKGFQVIEDWSHSGPKDFWQVQPVPLPAPDYAASVATIGACPFELTTLTSAEFLGLL